VLQKYFRRYTTNFKNTLDFANLEEYTKYLQDEANRPAKEEEVAFFSEDGTPRVNSKPAMSQKEEENSIKEEHSLKEEMHSMKEEVSNGDMIKEEDQQDNKQDENISNKSREMDQIVPEEETIQKEDQPPASDEQITQDIRSEETADTKTKQDILFQEPAEEPVNGKREYKIVSIF